MVDQTQLQELSIQLQSAVEQCRQIDRQIQLTANQKKKTEVTVQEVEKRQPDQIQYRSVGRMFVMVSKEELASDLNADLSRMATETQKNTAMKTVLDQKKDQLTKQLNDLVPNAR